MNDYVVLGPPDERVIYRGPRHLCEKVASAMVEKYNGFIDPLPIRPAAWFYPTLDPTNAAD